MKISRQWLQRYFDTPLPSAEVLADALTFHAFEIESIENDILDVKVTANRGHDCLSHRGIARELSAILETPLSDDPLRLETDIAKRTDSVSVEIQEPELCARYIAGYLRGVSVGPSPEWLRKSLEALGQRSINNVVDATNFVMFDLGQPLHAFDAGKLSIKDDTYAIEVRLAHEGEKMIALDDKEYTLSDGTLVISDAHDRVAIGIAGIKGGAPASITEETTDIIIESANFDGASVRKSAQALKLRTDASSRFEQVLSPELPAYGMQAVVALIQELAGGTLEGFVDVYPRKSAPRTVSVALAKVCDVLGMDIGTHDVERALTRLDLAFHWQGGTVVVDPPFERLDLVIREDLIEEIGRILGYDKVPATELPTFPNTPEIDHNFVAAEHLREEFVQQGFSEVYTSVFAEKGDREVLNKVGGERPYLRTNLTDGLTESHQRNMRMKDLLGLTEVKLFEIGTVWRGGKEEIVVGRIHEEKGKSVASESTLTPVNAVEYDHYPISETARYRPFSKYPFIVRDIALWVPETTSAEDVLAVLRSHAGELLVQSSLFDEFKKDGRISYAFRLIFQSFDKTLTDQEANERMESVYSAVKDKGWDVR